MEKKFSKIKLKNTELIYNGLTRLPIYPNLSIPQVKKYFLKFINLLIFMNVNKSSYFLKIYTKNMKKLSLSHKKILPLNLLDVYLRQF